MPKSSNIPADYLPNPYPDEVLLEAVSEAYEPEHEMILHGLFMLLAAKLTRSFLENERFLLIWIDDLLATLVCPRAFSSGCNLIMICWNTDAIRSNDLSVIYCRYRTGGRVTRRDISSFLGNWPYGQCVSVRLDTWRSARTETRPNRYHANISSFRFSSRAFVIF